MFEVMFLNVADPEHVYLSLTRLYMSLLMVSPMALLMLFAMKKMYTDKTVNTLIVISGLLVFAVSLMLLRTQTPISDVQYMKAMTPHHSSAIVTSRHADLKDPEVRKLAEGIIKFQETEIKEMKRLLEKIER